MYSQKSFTQNEKYLPYKMGFVCIYFMRNDPDPSSPTKIGMANLPFKRLGELQTANWRECVFHEILFIGRNAGTATNLDFLEGVDFQRKISAKQINKAARANFHLKGFKVSAVANDESRIHKVLKAAGRHVQGEWFSGDPDELVSVARGIISEINPTNPVMTAAEMKGLMENVKEDLLLQLVEAAA